MNNLISFFKQIIEKRYLIYQLTKRDFVQKYVESYLGIAWAILEPLATTVILSTIFIFGFKAGEVKGAPFFVYMFSGIVAYNYFSVAVGEGAQVIKAYSFLVKKVNFRVSILPLVKVLSCSVVHLIMLALLAVILIFHGFFPNWYWLQIIYYFFAMNVLILGISWLTSAISVFVPDLKHLVTIGLQFLFYLSPIFWSMDTMPEKWAFWLKLNPMYYIVNGYRETFLFETPFWTHGAQNLYFWSVTLVILLVGIIVFRRLRPHFADVL